MPNLPQFKIIMDLTSTKYICSQSQRQVYLFSSPTCILLCAIITTCYIYILKCNASLPLSYTDKELRHQMYKNDVAIPGTKLNFIIYYHSYLVIRNLNPYFFFVTLRDVPYVNNRERNYQAISYIHFLPIECDSNYTLPKSLISDKKLNI